MDKCTKINDRSLKIYESIILTSKNVIISIKMEKLITNE